MNRSMTDRSSARNVRVDVFAAQMRGLDRHEREALSQELERQEVAELERSAIARRIKQARQEAGLSQPEMADALGVIDRTYQNYESVKKPRVPWGSMNDIARITGKSTEWLIHGERHTPDLLGAAKETQVTNGFEEFRGYVQNIRQDVSHNQARLDALEELGARLYKVAVENQRAIAAVSGQMQAITDALGLTGPDASLDALRQAREVARRLAARAEQSREAQ